jgi:hypothetical protein
MEPLKYSIKSLQNSYENLNTGLRDLELSIEDNMRSILRLNNMEDTLPFKVLFKLSEDYSDLDVSFRVDSDILKKEENDYIIHIMKIDMISNYISINSNSLNELIDDIHNAIESCKNNDNDLLTFNDKLISDMKLNSEQIKKIKDNSDKNVFYKWYFNLFRKIDLALLEKLIDSQKNIFMYNEELKKASTYMQIELNKMNTILKSKNYISLFSKFRDIMCIYFQGDFIARMERISDEKENS